jgi:hypothetical protein
MYLAIVVDPCVAWTERDRAFDQNCVTMRPGPSDSRARDFPHRADFYLAL